LFPRLNVKYSCFCLFQYSGLWEKMQVAESGEREFIWK